MEDWTYEDRLSFTDALRFLPVDEIADNAELSRLDERAEVYATLQDAGMLRYRLQIA